MILDKMIYGRFVPAIRYSFALAALLLGGLILVKSLTPMQVSVSVPGMDKIVHLCAYFVLGVLCLPALTRIRPVIVWLGLAIFGAGIEVGQGLISAGRTADPIDELANICGAALAVLFWLTISGLWRWIRVQRDLRS